MGMGRRRLILTLPNTWFGCLFFPLARVFRSPLDVRHVLAMLSVVRVSRIYNFIVYCLGCPDVLMFSEDP